jgi:uncharacterized repeat protein (TIGR03803 family)
MKPSPIHRLSVILISVVLIFASPVFGDDTTDMLSKALDLVQQVETSTGNPPTDAQRIDLLTQAITMAQEAPNHRLKRHRVLAIQAIRSAIAEIGAGDPNHQAATYLHTADTELSTSISLAGAAESPGQPGDASVSSSPVPSPSAAPPSTPVPTDGTSPQEVITRLVANASKKPLGPVENDVTEQTVSTATAALKSSPPAGGGSLRDSIVSDFIEFTLEGPLTSLYSDGSAALFYGTVKLTEDDLANHGDVSDAPSFGDSGGYTSWIGPKTKDDAHVIATFCLVQQHGLWKVHAVYLSNEPLQGDNKDFIIRQLEAFAKTLSGPAIPAGQSPPSSATASGNPSNQAEPTPEYTVLHNFGDGSVPRDGENPCTSLVLGPDGNLYGVTRSIDSNTSGNITINTLGKLATIYKMTPLGKVTILRSFNAGNSDNDPLPEYPLTLGSDGSFYGTMSGGGQNKCGMVYKITSQGVFTPVYQFGNPSIKDDPACPSAPLIKGVDGNFYGTSDSGGSAENGAVFKMTPQGVVTTLHSFLDGSVPHDGDSPGAPLVLGPDGNYYGTTFNGSGVEDKPDFKGTLFKITPGGMLTILHRFADGSVLNDGNASRTVGLFMAKDNSLYGTTQLGGTTSGSGTFFKFTTDGAVTILHSFHQDLLDKDGIWPQPTLVEGPDGNFYGTTSAGGSANEGTIFKITPEGTVTLLHNFCDGTIPNDGIKPEGGLVLASDGCLYGTTSEGGSAGKGVVFRIKVP